MKPILQKVWIIWPRLLYFNFRSLTDPDCSSFIRFQCILYDSIVIFSESWNIYKSKRGDLDSGGNEVCRKFELFGPPLLYFYFKSFLDPTSSSFIRFQWFLHGLAVLFSESWNFLKSKRRELIFGGNQFCRKSELFAPPFRSSLLKGLLTQILHHSLDFNSFRMIREYFSQSFEVSRN